MKDAVNICIITQGGATDCDGGANGVPASYNGPAGSNLGSVGVTDGVITATASNNNGLSGQTAVLTPTLASNSSVTWCLTGSNDAGLSSSCSGSAGYACSGNSCTYNGTAYTMWPAAQSGYVVGSLANFAVLMTGHSGSELNALTNPNIHTAGAGDLWVPSLILTVSCSVGTCYKLTVRDSTSAVVGFIYAPGSNITTPYTWQTTIP